MEHLLPGFKLPVQLAGNLTHAYVATGCEKGYGGRRLRASRGHVQKPCLEQ